MKYFIDSEFYEDGLRIYPISLGVAAEDGRELYMEFDTSEHEHWWKFGGWHKDNVVPDVRDNAGPPSQFPEGVLRLEAVLDVCGRT